MALMGVDVSRDRIKAAESIWDPRDAEATAAVAVFGSSLSLSRSFKPHLSRVHLYLVQPGR